MRKEKAREDGGKRIRLADTGRFTAVMMMLLGLLLLGILLNVNIGSVHIGAGEVFGSIGRGIKYLLLNLFSGGRYRAELDAVVNASTESQILFRIRLPRMLLAMILGGALSVSGYLLQVFFRNPIAGPFVLGISSGAKMVVGLTLIFLFRRISGLSSFSLIIAAFAGSMLITLLVLLFSQKVQNMSMLLVVGIMVGYICSAVTEFAVTFAQEHDVVNLTNWAMGSFSGASWGDVRMSAAICFPVALAAFALSKPISAYNLGEGYARSMGVNIKAVRAAIILISSLLSATVTALAGPVSFVGIAVPHIAKSLLKSSKPGFVIPAVFVSGGVFCLFCDLIARTAFSPAELSIGTVTSVFGAPVVIYMMINRRRQQEV